MESFILFYNPSHDAERRIAATAPAKVRRVPWGWTPDAEANRNAVLAQIGVGVASLPALAIWRDEATVVTGQDDNGEDVTEVVPAHYEVLTADDPRVPKPWDWRNLPGGLR